MNNKKKIKNNKKINKIAISIGLGVFVISLISVIIYIRNKEEASNSQSGTIESQVSETGDLVIPVADITEKASFYEYEVDGTKLEVIAIKASDGTIRTAFNTCQVCYSSGRGYYKQEGDYLVCQNCGNRFKASDVEVSKGGCNPVPIFDENKTVDETNITISKDFLEESAVLFENWKS